MKTFKHFCSQHLAALSLALVGALGLFGIAATAAPVADAASCTTVSCVQQFGNQQISARLTALEKSKTDAKNNKALTEQQQGIIVNDANTNENGLNALKKQLDAETSIKPALADVKNIYVQFRIYAVVLPRDYGEIELFHEQNVSQRMTDAEVTINDLIQKDQNGKNIAQIKTLDQDYVNKLNDAATYMKDAQGLIPSLVPANYPGTDATLNTYHQDLKTARLDLQGAAKDLHQMTQLLKADLGGSNGGSSS
jgi:hypothetical protein